MSLTMPVEIEHLDFTPSEDLFTIVDEDTDMPKTCELLRRKGLANPTRCGRLAVYVLVLGKPCGHLGEVYLCQECWQTLENYSAATWICREKIDSSTCGTSYVVRDAVISVDRVK